MLKKNKYRENIGAAKENEQNVVEVDEVRQIRLEVIGSSKR